MIRRLRARGKLRVRAQGGIVVFLRVCYRREREEEEVERVREVRLVRREVELGQALGEVVFRGDEEA
jgi:hypothetical protein